MISPMIKTITVFLNFAFNCRPVSETCMIAIMQAGMQADQLVNKIDHAGNITNSTENHTRKSFFFLQDSKEMCSFIFVSFIKQVYQKNITFVKTIDMYVVIKAIIRKTNCYLHMCFFFDLY